MTRTLITNCYSDSSLWEGSLRDFWTQHPWFSGIVNFTGCVSISGLF